MVAALTRPGFLRAMARRGAGWRAAALRPRARAGAGVTARAWRRRRAGRRSSLVGALAPSRRPRPPRPLRWVPLLLGLVLFALPHGAVDHHVPRRLGRAGGPRVHRGLPRRRRRRPGPRGPSLRWRRCVAFLVVAAVHWGSGDAWYARTVHRRAPFARAPRRRAVRRRARRAARRAARARPSRPSSRAAAHAILGAVGAGAGARAPGGDAGRRPRRRRGCSSWRPPPARVRRRPRPAGGRRSLDVGELALLAAFFVVTPAILAVGTYLLAWHAPRHVARLIAADPAQAALPPGRGARRLDAGGGAAHPGQPRRPRGARRHGLARPGRDRRRRRCGARADRRADLPARRRRGLDGPRAGGVRRPDPP